MLKKGYHVLIYDYVWGQSSMADNVWKTVQNGLQDYTWSNVVLLKMTTTLSANELVKTKNAESSMKKTNAMNKYIFLNAKRFGSSSYFFTLLWRYLK